MKKQIDITPETKVGEMLEAYPHLEETLLELSPSFAKLKNPILRKTIGKVASLRQVAQVGGLNVGNVVSALRKAVGLDNENIASDNFSEVESPSYPTWMNIADVSVTFDACDIIEKGESPMKEILSRASQLSKDEILLLITPFKPTPIIDILESKNYLSWSEQKQNKVYTYFKKL